MQKKDATKENHGNKKGKRYHVDFSLTAMCFWGLGLLFLLAWIFVLGIFVGRGFLPKEGVNAMAKIKTQIVKLQDAVSKKDSKDLDLIKKFNKDPEFAFYEELSKKNEEKIEKSPLDTKKSESPKKPEKSLKKTLDKTKKPSESSGQYAIQIASFDDELKAVGLAKLLSNRGYPAYYYKVNVKGKAYYRVRCGKFEDKKEANKFLKLLAKKEKIKGFLSKIEK